MVNIEKIQQFNSMQLECLILLIDLIKYDKTQADNNLQPENTRVLEAFIDTQHKALTTINILIEKHKASLEKIANDAKAKEEEKQKNEKKVIAIAIDQDKAKKDETSLFYDNNAEGECENEENC